jgi:hypothetical protein
MVYNLNAHTICLDEHRFKSPEDAEEARRVVEPFPPFEYVTIATARGFFLGITRGDANEALWQELRRQIAARRAEQKRARAVKRQARKERKA